MNTGTNLVDATKIWDESVLAGDMMESWVSLKKLCFLHGFSSIWTRGLVGKESGGFADSPFILSNCPEIKDGSPSAWWLPVLV